MDVRNNVVYYNFDSSSIVLLSGTNNTIARNLALGNTKVMKSPHDMDLPATYEIWAPGNSVTGNIAAGSERLGFRVIADSCNGTADFAGNVAHTSLIGLYLHQGSDGKVPRTCTAVRKFQAWRVRLQAPKSVDTVSHAEARSFQKISNTKPLYCGQFSRW